MLGIALAIGAVILVAVQANNNSVSQAAQQAGDEAEVVVVPAEVHRDGLRPSSLIWAAVIASIERRMLDRAQV